MKKKILRKCCSCGEIKDRAELIKITRNFETGEVVVNPDSKFFGRSAYLCYNIECLQIAVKKKKIQKSLRCNVDQSLIDEVKKQVESKCQN